MRDRGSKLPGPKGGPEREEQVTIFNGDQCYGWGRCAWVYFGCACLGDAAFGEAQIFSIEDMLVMVGAQMAILVMSAS